MLELTLFKMFIQSILQSIYRLRSAQLKGEGDSNVSRLLSFSLMYLLCKMFKLAPRVFLLCLLLFGSNCSSIQSGKVPIILLWAIKHLLMSDSMAPTLKYYQVHSAMALLGVKDDSSTAFLQLKYLIYIIMTAAACLGGFCGYFFI